MIVCLGWGSLIWRPEGLPVGEWRADGPEVKVEFVRESTAHHLTLVLDQDADEPVTSLWAPMTVRDLDAAVTELTRRERTHPRKIGRWSTGQDDPQRLPGLGEWTTGRDVDHVIWTALEPKFRNQEWVRPTEDQALSHLRNLTGSARTKAEEYVRRTPGQIRTAYRRRFERCLGWTPTLVGEPNSGLA